MKNLILLSAIILMFSCKKQDIELKSFNIGSTIVSTQRTKDIKQSANEAKIVMFLNQEVTSYLGGLSIYELDIVLQDVNTITRFDARALDGSPDCDKTKQSQITLYLGFEAEKTDVIVFTLKSPSSDNVLNEIWLLDPNQCKEVSLTMQNKLI